MSESTRKTDARVAERERRRKQREAKAKLWKTIPLLGIAILALLGAGIIANGTFFQPSVSGTNGPRLQLDREQVDFGDQHFGTTVRATFKVTNAGDGTLNLNLPKTATVVQGC
jgi:hypothetical protein